MFVFKVFKKSFCALFDFQFSCDGEKFHKAKEWKVPTVSIQWLNDVFFGNMNAVQCMNNPKYQNFRVDDPFKIEYTLVPNLMVAWKTPIRVTPVSFQDYLRNSYFVYTTQNTYFNGFNLYRKPIKNSKQILQQD